MGAPADGQAPDVLKWSLMTIRVFLLDDHEIVRTGLRSLLESTDDLEVVGEAGDGQEAAALAGVQSENSICAWRWAAGGS